MNTENVIVRLGGVLMLGVFGINVYIGLYDTNLSQISPVHEQLNWVIAGADLLAAVFLLAKPRNMILKSLGGIVWPIFFVANLFIDVGTRLCLGEPQTLSYCSPSVSDAYQYLILGSAGQEWVLWPYTIRLAIGLAVVVLILSLLSLKFRATSKKPKSLPFQNNQSVTSEQDQAKNGSSALRGKFRGSSILRALRRM